MVLTDFFQTRVEDAMKKRSHCVGYSIRAHIIYFGDLTEVSSPVAAPSRAVEINPAHGSPSPKAQEQ